MGENGAGKSTLIKLLTGVYPADSGTVLYQGGAYEPNSPADAMRKGVSPVYQEINLIPTLSVAENICLGRLPRRFGFIDWRGARRLAITALGRLGLTLDVNAPLGAYSTALQQLVAISRALDIEARVLILDEPTSSLDGAETERLMGVMRQLRADGIGIVFITHFLDQVYAVADRITVLRNGKLVGTWETAELPSVELVTKMIGRELEEMPQRFARLLDTPNLVEAKGLGRRRALDPIDLDIRKGEVVGLAGLLGSGRTEMARLLFGADRADTGTVRIQGAEMQKGTASPRAAIRLGMAYCAEDRRAEGIFPKLSVRENIALPLQAKHGWFRRVRGTRDLARSLVNKLRIATPDIDRPIGGLSGGNQQKTIIAGRLAAEPLLLILDEPTRGVDVAAKAEIQRLILELAQEGKSVLFISSELDEVLRCCDRIAVLRDRKKVTELVGDEIEEKRVLSAIGESS